ncbi:AMP-binding protein [Streptomyces sp. NPDC059398]|uniref:AMP-binding protein n=1 Tax=Streptomyces sp. NPDC059398 TaxID=3346820 RepID=UPI003684F6AD
MSSDLPGIGDWHSFAELRLLQDRLLPAVLERASRSPFYRGRPAAEQSAGLAERALTTKSDLRDSYPFGMLAVDRDQLATYHESSGSTGTPTPSYYTEREWVDLAERFARKSVPMSSADTLLVRIPYALVIAGHLAHQAGLMKGATVIAGDCRTMAAPYSRIIRVLHDLGVSLTWSTASECLVWAAGARLAGYDPGRDFPALRALYVGGEPLSGARRDRITELWNAPVVEEYGCTEVGTMAGTCPHGRMHFWADRVLPEILDPDTGEVTREGTGRLVITPLHREAMPLLRYNLEDQVELRHEECPCGWYLPTVRVLGRVAHGLTVAGRGVSPLQVEEAVFRLPAEYGVLFWRGRAEPGLLRVQLEVADAYAGDACAEAARHLKEVLDVPAEVTALPPGSLVPEPLLLGRLDAMKPRKLFGPDEDWDAAVLAG